MPTDAIYRIRFELVLQQELHKYCEGDKQVVPNSRIPDESWGMTYSMATDSPWQQLSQLKLWEAEDVQFVRKVTLERLVSEPRWEEVAMP